MIATTPHRTDSRRRSLRRRSGAAGSWLQAHAAIVGAAFALPGIFVLLRTVQLGTEVGATLQESAAPLGRTLLLSMVVALAATILGTGLAWLVVRTNLPGRRWWQMVLVLPLVLPSFIGASAFLTALAPGGLLHDLIGVVGLEPPRSFRGFGPASFVLTLFTFPYVLLPVSARLSSLRPSMEESARLLGRSPLNTFWTVTVPQVRSAMIGGALIVFLYTASDFGAVQLLGYDTLTRVIYATRLTNRGVSFTSATVLIVVTVVAVISERGLRARPGADERARQRPLTPVALGRWTVPALGAVLTVVTASLLAPVASLATWSIRGLADGRVDLGELLVPTINTALIGVVTAVVTVAVVVPLAVVSIRHRSTVAEVSAVLVVGGFAVPGIVIALSLVFWSLNTPGVEVLYKSFPLLVFAYVIHFGAQALGASEVAVRAVPERLRESSRLLSPSRWRRRREVEAPLMRPGLAGAAGLVLLSTIKELPATLLLAPIGFDTLATEVWGSYADGFYAAAGAASLLLIALSALLTWLLVLRNLEVDGRRR